MTISIRRIDPKFLLARGATRRSGFTLIEVLVSATLCSFIVAGVLGAFLWLGRGGFAASSYSELEAETRRALEIFGEEARKSANIHWNNSQSITLWVATATNLTLPVTYAYDSNPSSSTHRCFYRLAGEETSTDPRRVLVRNVEPSLEFRRFKLERPGAEDNVATNDLETKQIEVTFRASRTAATAVASTQSALSARYVLRNKRVSN